MSKQVMSARLLLVGFLFCGLGCQSKGPGCPTPKISDISVCIYSEKRHGFECGDNKHIWTIPTAMAEGYIAYPPSDHDKLMSQCLNPKP